MPPLRAWQRCRAWGHYREDLADARHRFWTVYSDVIAYRNHTRPLEIIAIVHGARHLEAFFQGRIGGQTSEAAEARRFLQPMAARMEEED
jgi:hypothetical protein